MAEIMKTGLLLCLYVMWHTNCEGYEIVECNEDDKLDVRAESATCLTCTEITADAIFWDIDRPETKGGILAQCSWPTEECSVPNNDYTVTRPQYDTSVLTVTTNHRHWLDGRIRCGGHNDNQPFALCSVRVLYPDNKNTHVAAVVGGVGGVLALVIVVVVAAVVTIKRKRKGLQEDVSTRNKSAVVVNPTYAQCSPMDLRLQQIQNASNQAEINVVSPENKTGFGYDTPASAIRQTATTNGHSYYQDVDDVLYSTPEGDEPASSTRSQPQDGDQYAVVNKPTAQKPAGSHSEHNVEADKARSKQKRIETGGIQETPGDAASGDVYAQVNKNPKRELSGSAGTPQPETETYAQVQKNRPTAKYSAKPAGLLEPALEGTVNIVQPASAWRQTTASGYEEVEVLNEMTSPRETADECNSLSARQRAPTELSSDPDAQCSHITALGL